MLKAVKIAANRYAATAAADFYSLSESQVI